MSLFVELRRRNVFRVGIAYAVAAWILLQLTDVVAEILELPGWAPKLILLLLIVGLVPALIFAWAFELTPEGIKREQEVDRSASITRQTGRKLDYVIIAMLALALGYFVWESRFDARPRPQDAAEALPAGVESPTTRGAPDKTIAVLPFTHRSADPNDIYFTDGIHDDLLTQLAKIGDLSVISRTSVLEYRDTTKNLKQIGEELGVAHIMEGAVQRSGDRVRINVQLIDADTDEHLWAETFDRELTAENLFDIQSEISRAIATALKATLTEQEIASVQEVPTNNVQAYELFLQARRFALGETVIGYNTAIELYEKALELDRGFKLAWVGLAHAHITNYWIAGGDPANRDKAWEVIGQARALDPNFPELKLALGAYYYWGFLDYETALENLDQAIRLLPGNADAHMWRGWALRRAGRWEEAVSAMRESLRLDPRVVFNWVELGQTLFYLHRFDESREALNRAQSLSRDDFWVKGALSKLELMETGDVERAITLVLGGQHTAEYGFISTYLSTQVIGRRFDAALEAIGLIPAGTEVQRQSMTTPEILRAEVLHYQGRTEDARAAAVAGRAELEALAAAYPGDYRLHAPRAMIHAILGEAEAAAAEVRAAIENSPRDAVEYFLGGFDLACILAIAGLGRETADLLETLLAPPSETTVKIVDRHPAFDAIREQPDFAALLERYR